jgi:hypothetical protein
MPLFLAVMAIDFTQTDGELIDRNVYEVAEDGTIIRD